MRHTQDPPPARLQVLLTDAGGQWAEKLPRLLEPQGVRAIRARTVDHALALVRMEPVHVAVIDLALPGDMGGTGGGRPARAPRRGSGGLKLVRVIQRLDPCPPTLLIRGRAFEPEDNRLLTEALKLEVFSVLDEPVEFELLLQTLQRLVERYYGGRWPWTSSGDRGKANG